MGRRGPQPAPAALKFVRGETRPSRTNPNEPDFPPACELRPPAGLTGPGLHEWKRLAALLTESGVLTDADVSCFEDYCRALSSLRAYEQKAKRAGLDVAITKGYQNAIVKLRSQVTQLRSHLGLTPSSRSSVKTVRRSGSKLNQFHRSSSIDDWLRLKRQ